MAMERAGVFDKAGVAVGPAYCQLLTAMGRCGGAILQFEMMFLKGKSGALLTVDCYWGGWVGRGMCPPSSGRRAAEPAPGLTRGATGALSAAQPPMPFSLFRSTGRSTPPDAPFCRILPPSSPSYATPSWRGEEFGDCFGCEAAGEGVQSLETARTAKKVKVKSFVLLGKCF